MSSSHQSPNAATEQNRDILLLKARAWAKADPLFTVKNLPGATAVFSGSSSDTFNILALEPAGSTNAFSIIEKARDTVFGENRFAVWSWELGQLQSLPISAEVIEENLIMTCTAGDLTAPAAGASDLETTPVTDPLHLMDVGGVLASVFGDNPEAFMLQSIYAGQDEASIERLDTHYLLAYEGGVAAATGSYILDGTLAGVFDIAVRPDLQKNGLGSRMFNAVIDAAVADGAQSFTLHASAKGAGIYERAGFKVAGTCWSLNIG